MADATVESCDRFHYDRLSPFCDLTVVLVDMPLANIVTVFKNESSAFFAFNPTLTFSITWAVITKNGNALRSTRYTCTRTWRLVVLALV